MGAGLEEVEIFEVVIPEVEISEEETPGAGDHHSSLTGGWEEGLQGEGQEVPGRNSAEFVTMQGVQSLCSSRTPYLSAPSYPQLTSQTSGVSWELAR